MEPVVQLTCRQLAYDKLYWALHAALGPIANQCKVLADDYGEPNLFDDWKNGIITTIDFFRLLRHGMDLDAVEFGFGRGLPQPIIDLARHQLDSLVEEAVGKVLRFYHLDLDHPALPITGSELAFERASRILDYLKATVHQAVP